ncbi:MAG: helix-hairpin-helix domain-containing protein [Bacteroidota bacterium]
MRRNIFIFICVLGSTCIYAQHETSPTNIERIIEEVFQGQDQDINYDELYEVLLLFLSNPIDLNQATEQDLASLYILSNRQVQAFFEYKKRFGELVSVYELQAIPEFDLKTLQRLKSFVKIDFRQPRGSLKGLPKRIWNESNNYLILRYERTLETKKGFKTPENDESSRYAGNADKFYGRFRTSYTKDFSLGFTVEKDAGEVFEFNRNQFGFDFVSFHAQIQKKGKLQNLILGDFQLQYGQGLVFGSGFSIGKGAETITTTRRVNLGALPYTSVSETGHFKGLVSTYQVRKNLTITGLYSSLNQDGRVINDSTYAMTPFVRSIQTSGLHRTQTERVNRNTVSEKHWGANIDYTKQNLNVGMNFLNTAYSIPIIRDEGIENISRFAGQNNTVVSTYVNYRKYNYVLFAEIARSTSGGIGSIAGIVSNISGDLDASIVIRNYDNNFHSFYSAGFGESTRNMGEKGIYLGIKHTINPKMSITAFFDGFIFTDIRSNISKPSSGYEYLARFNYKPNKQTLLYAQFRQQSKADNINNTELPDNLKRADNALTRSYLINLDHKVSAVLSTKSRLQGSHRSFNGKSTTGFALVQDVNLNYSKWSLSTRIALFDTDDFDNRQYIFERDVLYTFSIPALSGTGLRNYLVLRFKASSKLDFWAKYGRTIFTDRKTVGSGLEEIDGNSRTVLRVQTRIKF